VNTPKLMTVSSISLTEEDLAEVKLTWFKICTMESRP
jgi:hypothetical protein